MSYEIIGDSSVNNIVSADTPLGVRLNFNTDSIFTYTYITIDQALENLKNLIFTQINERYENIEFGTNLLRMIFEPNVSEIKQDIAEALTIPMARWTPYIEIVNLDIITDQDDSNLNHDIRITLTFTIPPLIDITRSLTISANEIGSLEIEENGN